MREYRPLVYCVGSKVRADHFDLGFLETSGFDIGGIYYVDGSLNRYLEYGSLGWIALIEPHGSQASWGNVRMSEEVTVVRIKAFCFQVSHPIKEITSGIVFNDEGLLMPLCSLEEHPNFVDKARFNFKITEDDQVLFSNI